MRRIILSDTEAALFDEEMVPGDYEFLNRHKDTFCRMWTEQGKTFWERYLQVFRSYVVRYSLLGDLPCDLLHLLHVLDYAFEVIEKNYVKGKVNQAKGFVFQIADLGRNRHRFAYLDNKSVSKDPFYTKDTRDLFREFFGQANEKSSYIRVYLLTPVYMRFGGSICRCLIRWKEAQEMDPSDDSYFTPPPPIQPEPDHEEWNAASVLCDHHLKDCNLKFYQQFVMGSSTNPVSLDFWGAEDPRFVERGNPLWNPDACPKSDWREGLTRENFEEFYTWCIFSTSLVKREDQCQDCRACRKAKKKQKKRKKKAAGAAAEFGYDEVSISADNLLPNQEGNNVPTLSDSPHVCVNSHAPFSEDVLAEPTGVSDSNKKKSQSGAQTTSQTSTSTSTSMSTSTSTPTSTSQWEAVWAGEQGREKSELGREDKEQLCGQCRCRQPYDDVDSGGAELAENAEKTQNGKVKKKRKTSAEQRSEAPAWEPGASGVAPSLPQEVKENLFGWRYLQSDRSKGVKWTEAIKMPARRGSVGDRTVHFEVERSSDPSTGATGVWVTLSNVDQCREGKQTGDAERLKSPDAPTLELGTRTFCTLSAAYLQDIVKGFPCPLLCAEGSSWCVTTVDYSALERADEATKFTLAVCNSPNADLAKELLIELLWYVVRRKKRPSVGWVMTEEDVFALCQRLDKSIEKIKGVTFSITTRGSSSYAATPVAAQELRAATSENRPQKDASVAVETEASTIAQATCAEKVARDVCPGAGQTSASKKRSHSDTGLSDTDTDMAGTPTAAANSELDAEGTQTTAVNKEEGGALSPTPDPLIRRLKDPTKIKSHAVPENGETVQSVPASVESKTSRSLTAQKPDTPSVVGKDSLASLVASTTSKASAEPSQPAGEATLSTPPADADTSGHLEGGKMKKKKKRSKHKDKGQAEDAEPAAEGAVAKESRTARTLEAVARERPQTMEELTQLLQAMQPDGKGGTLTHTIIHSSPFIDSKGAARPVTASGDAGHRLEPADRELSICYYCCATEPALRTFKKCQRCKLEGVVRARYYCGRPCQEEDWKLRHSQEHATGVLH